MAKFGRIKRQHGRVQGLDKLLDQILRDCPYVQRIVPGRMGRKRGNTPAVLRVKYTTGRSAAQPTDTDAAPGAEEGLSGVSGVKCIYTQAGSWQEVFLICDDAQAAENWLRQQPYAQ